MAKYKLLLFVVVALFLVAFQVVTELSQATEEVITLIVALILGLLGTRPLNWIKQKLGVEDEIALLVLYFVSGVIGMLGLLASGQFFEIEFSWMNIVSIGGTFILAAKYAYERTKSRS